MSVFLHVMVVGSHSKASKNDVCMDTFLMLEVTGALAASTVVYIEAINVK